MLRHYKMKFLPSFSDNSKWIVLSDNNEFIQECSYGEASNIWKELIELKTYDKVIVTRKSSTNNLGWRAAWVDDMNIYINNICIVRYDLAPLNYESSWGIPLILDLEKEEKQDPYYFPFFVLEKVT